jgi:hypothetical protein
MKILISFFKTFQASFHYQCWTYLIAIQSLPTTIGELKHLMKLWLRGCENLKELPRTIASLLIININLSYYKSIKSLSTTIG